MHSHHQQQCQHTFKYCIVCDTVYCEQCKGEWWRKTNGQYIWPTATAEVKHQSFAVLHVHEATNPV